MKYIVLVLLIYSPFEKPPLMSEVKYQMSSQATIQECHDIAHKVIENLEKAGYKYSYQYICEEVEFKAPGLDV